MTADDTPIEILATEKIVRDAVRVWIWRRFVRQEKLLWLVAGAMALLFIWLLFAGRSDWLIWLVGGFAVLPVAMVLLCWVLMLRRKLDLLRRSGRAILVLGQDGIGVTSAAGTGLVRWDQISGYWEMKDYWIVLLGANDFFTLPRGALDGDDLAALRARLDLVRG